MRANRYDESRWPVVVFTAPQDFCEVEFEAHLRQISSYFDRGERFAMVVDLCNADDISAHRRKEIADLVRRKETETPHRLCALAFVVSSTFQRLAIAGMVSFCPPRWPLRPFATVEAAIAWARDRVTEVLREELTPPHQTEPSERTSRPPKLVQSVGYARREGVWVVDSEGATAFVSEGMACMLHRTPGALIGVPATELLGAPARSDWVEALHRRSECPGLHHFPLPDGETALASIEAVTLRDLGGRFQGVFSVVRELGDSREGLRSERSLSADGQVITFLDLDLRIQLVNGALALIGAVDGRALRGQHCYAQRYGRSKPCPFCPSIKACQSKSPAEIHREAPDGRRWRLSSWPVLGRDREVVGVVELAQSLGAARGTDPATGTDDDLE